MTPTTTKKRRLNGKTVVYFLLKLEVLASSIRYMTRNETPSLMEDSKKETRGIRESLLDRKLAEPEDNRILQDYYPTRHLGLWSLVEWTLTTLSRYASSQAISKFLNAGVDAWDEVSSLASARLRTDAKAATDSKSLSTASNSWSTGSWPLLGVMAQSSPQNAREENGDAGINTVEIKGVSGKRFTGDKLRQNQVALNFKDAKRSELKQDEKHCKKWIVVTSIFQPSAAVRKLGEMTQRGWCFVIVGDLNGPSSMDDVEGVVYLTPDVQRRLHYHIIDHIPWKHFGRKNIGYLYAIEHGAEIIYDTDDDNRIINHEIPYIETVTSNGEADLGGEAGKVEVRTYEEDAPFQRTVRSPVINPYRDFESTCEAIWPRGYPLDNVNDHLLLHPNTTVYSTGRPPAIQQFLAEEDPDVDAIYRLTHKLPCSFKKRNQVLVLPKGKLTPYNAQCVVNRQRAFWGLMLPVTVNGRVSDIWRSYITQKLLWDIGESLAILPSYVVHDRVAHDYLKDFQSESDLYLKSAALVKFLSSWQSGAPTLVERIEQLNVELYERGFIEVGDLRLAQAWIRDLLALGYNFPDLEIPKIVERSMEL